MGNMPLKENIILFETGAYSFKGKPMFNFSLIRQFPNYEKECYQIHVVVLYIPTEGNNNFQQTILNMKQKPTDMALIKVRDLSIKKTYTSSMPQIYRFPIVLRDLHIYKPQDII